MKKPMLAAAASLALGAPASAHHKDPACGAVMPPLYLSSNYSFSGFGQKRPSTSAAQKR